MRRLGIILAAVLMAGIVNAEPTIQGRASVIDGDTIEIAGERIRLHGIDAPESRQECQDKAGEVYRCGKASAEALDAYLAISRPVRCEYADRDHYGRFVGICFLSNGRNVNAFMVRSGNALDWPRYSKGMFAREQEQARAAGRGIWQGAFIEPWEWRKR